jgi:hypothetical protein
MINDRTNDCRHNETQSGRDQQMQYIGRFVWQIKYNLEAWAESLAHCQISVASEAHHSVNVDHARQPSNEFLMQTESVMANLADHRPKS